MPSLCHYNPFPRWALAACIAVAAQVIPCDCVTAVNALTNQNTAISNSPMVAPPKPLQNTDIPVTLENAMMEVDIDQPTGESIMPELFGANIGAGVESSWPHAYYNLGDKNFQEAVRQLDLPMLTLSMGGQLMGDTYPAREAKPHWNIIDHIIKHLPIFHGKKLFITLGGIPKWLDISKPDDRELHANMAEEVARRFSSAGITVHYWEVMDEPDSLGVERYEAFCKLYQLDAARLKTVYPESLVGGPAIAYPQGSLIKVFLQHCDANADFLSYHQFGGGPDELHANTPAMMVRAMSYKKDAISVRQWAKKHDAARKMPVFLTSYNMNYGWQPTEPRQATVTGAVYVALALISAAEEGVCAANIWQLYGDGTFGIIESPSCQIRPVGYLLSALAKYLPGTITKSAIQSENSNTSIQMQSLAVVRDGGKTYCLMFVNYSESTRYAVQVNVRDIKKRPIMKAERYELSKPEPAGKHLMLPVSQQLADITVPAQSVVLLKVRLE